MMSPQIWRRIEFGKDRFDYEMSAKCERRCLGSAHDKSFEKRAVRLTVFFLKHVQQDRN